MISFLIASTLAQQINFNIWSYSTGLCGKPYGIAVKFDTCSPDEQIWSFDTVTKSVSLRANSTKCLGRGIKRANRPLEREKMVISISDCDATAENQRFEFESYFTTQSKNLKTIAVDQLCLSTMGGSNGNSLMMQPCQFTSIGFSPKLMVGFHEPNVLPLELRLKLNDQKMDESLYKQLASATNPTLKFEEGTMTNSASYLALVNNKLHYRSNPFYCVATGSVCEGCSLLQLEKMPCNDANQWEFKDGAVTTLSNQCLYAKPTGVVSVATCRSTDDQKWTFQ